MELIKKIIAFMIICVVLPVLAIAVTQKVFVDTNYNLHNLFNISNVTIVGRFSDGTLIIMGGNISDARSIEVINITGTLLNFTNMYEGNYKVATLKNVSDSNASVIPYIDTRDQVINVSLIALDNLTNVTLYEQVVRLDSATNDSLEQHRDRENASMGVYVRSQDNLTNISSTDYADERDIAFNGSMVERDTDTNDTLVEHLVRTYIPSADEGDLNVNDSDTLDSIDSTQFARTDTDETFDQDVVITGNLTVLGDEVILNVTTQSVNGSIQPALNNTFDLGPSFDFIWKTLRVGVLYAVSYNLMQKDIPAAFINTSEAEEINKSAIEYCDARDVILNATEINWSRLGVYPAACPANTYLTQLDDSATCTGISDVYLLNTGDDASDYNYNFSNISASYVNAKINCSNITEAVSNLCTLTDTDTTNSTDDVELAAAPKFVNRTNWNTTDNYPDACAANYYMTGIGDTLTCAAPSASQITAGAFPAGAYNYTGNVTINSGYYQCFDHNCNSSIYYNGSSLVIKVN